MRKEERIERAKSIIKALKKHPRFTPEMEEKFDKAVSEFDLAKITKDELIWITNWVLQASHKTKPHMIPKEMFATQEEADEEYFIPRGGRCLGEKRFWYGEVEPVLAKWVKKGKFPKFLQKEQLKREIVNREQA